MGIPKEFRAWDKERNILAYELCEWDFSETIIAYHHVDENGRSVCSSRDMSDVIIEQFTGAYDSTTWQELTEEERAEWTRHWYMPSEWKGRKVFEGDRVSFDGNITADDSMGYEPNGYIYDETNVHTVVWNKNLLAWDLDFEDDEEMKYKRDTRALLLAGRCKVIGNIHETPELLETSK